VTAQTMDMKTEHRIIVHTHCYQMAGIRNWW